MEIVPRWIPTMTPPSRRSFLLDGVALAALLQGDGFLKASDAVWSPPNGKGHHTPQAKSVIWIFLSGGYSHIETFDPKPALNKYAGKTFTQTPFSDPLKSPLHDKRSRSVVADAINVRDKYPIVYPLQVGFKKYGQSGIEVCDWLPHIGSCVDDIAFVRSMYTTDNDHAAENQIHTGRHRLDEVQPSVGSWIQYGLGTLNDNLPQYVVLGGPTRPDTRPSVSASYLGQKFNGVTIHVEKDEPLPHARRSADVLADEQKNEYDLIGQLNRAVAERHPDDTALRARIKSYELAFRMQTSVPEAIDGERGETDETKRLYGLDNPTTRLAGQRLLAARRLAERGVRFIQVFPSPYGVWDSHQKLRENHAKQCQVIDKPVAGLLKDLKRRGLLDDVVVVFCTEFGRTPGMEQRSGGKDGRDHHPHGFTIWLAGAGLKRGHVYGATDELGFHAIEPGHYVTDLHATVLHLLGLDLRRLEVPGRKRLEADHGNVIKGILA